MFDIFSGMAARLVKTPSRLVSITTDLPPQEEQIAVIVTSVREELSKSEDQPLTVSHFGPKTAGGAYVVYGIEDPYGHTTRLMFKTGATSPGLTIESLLEVVADRLKTFQAGKYPCEENDKALAGVNAALDALYTRPVRPAFDAAIKAHSEKDSEFQADKYALTTGPAEREIKKDA